MRIQAALLRLALLAAVVLAGVLLVRERARDALAGPGGPAGAGVTAVRVVRVVDGDTIHVTDPAGGGREVTVRYIG
ncbi:MAG: hypothetical protein JWM31_610, partial [Solirubrobacterales bacterium]|nr:hypothetical protein [Solirubrobacterales bacterium]